MCSVLLEAVAHNAARGRRCSAGDCAVCGMVGIRHCSREILRGYERLKRSSRDWACSLDGLLDALIPSFKLLAHRGVHGQNSLVQSCFLVKALLQL